MSPMHRSHRKNVNTSPASLDATLGSKRSLFKQPMMAIGKGHGPEWNVARKIKGGARVFQPKAKHHAVFESHTGIRGFMTMTNRY